METTRLQRPSRVRIESASTVPGTRVDIDDVDVTNDVVAVTWTVDANSRRPPTATVDFYNVQIVAEAETEAITRTLKASFPGHQILIVDGGLELSVLRPEGKPTPGFATPRDAASFLAMFTDEQLAASFTPEFTGYARSFAKAAKP